MTFSNTRLSHRLNKSRKVRVEAKQSNCVTKGMLRGTTELNSDRAGRRRANEMVTFSNMRLSHRRSGTVKARKLCCY